jgi:transcriptional regulator with GAF, ATPase, and Fis domain
MNARGFVTISMHELERVKIIEAVVEHRLKVFQAAERLQLCERQVNRLVQRYDAAGPAALKSG